MADTKKKAEAPPQTSPAEAAPAEAKPAKKAGAKPEPVARAGGWVDYGDGKGYVLDKAEEE